MTKAINDVTLTRHMAGERVLIVEDNPLNLKLARVLLTTAGYEVEASGDAESAMASIKTLRPDLILMDLQLPGMDGLALTRLLKNDPNTKGIVIVALTAYAMKGDDLKAMTAGCDGYVTKPIDTLTFASTVAKYLDDRAPGVM